MQFEDPRSACAGGERDGEAAQDAGDDQPGRAGGEQKRDPAQSGQHERREHDRPPADLIGEAAQEEHGCDGADDVDRVDDGERQLREAECLPVDYVERGRQVAQDVDCTELRGHCPHRRRAPQHRARAGHEDGARWRHFACVVTDERVRNRCEQRRKRSSRRPAGPWSRRVLLLRLSLPSRPCTLSKKRSGLHFSQVGSLIAAPVREGGQS